jgi:uncharacterized protein (DUF924 family)
VDFWAERGRIVVFNCNLKFDTREKACDYIAQHWRDADDDPDARRKWPSEILVYDQLGREFFRPKRLEFDARPYSYNSAGSVKKSRLQLGVGDQRSGRAESRNRFAGQ